MTLDRESLYHVTLDHVTLDHVTQVHVTMRPMAGTLGTVPVAVILEDGCQW